jgi:hypothetical protein
VDFIALCEGGEDIANQAVGEGELAKGRKDKVPAYLLGLALGNPWLFRPSLPLRRDGSLVSSSAKLASLSLVFLW